MTLGGASAIGIGTILLLLPWERFLPNPCRSFMFFIATSAGCCTGLLVADTATEFTVFGHTIVLVLIQIGGLGYVTLLTMLLLTMRRHIGLKNRMMMMAEALSTLTLQGLIP